MDEAKQPVKKNVSNDIIIVLKQGTGAPKNSIGLTDPRLFTGENKLHAIMDTQTTLWHLHYENGIIPQALKGQWTGFRQLLAHVKNYFDKRNIDVIQVID